KLEEAADAQAKLADRTGKAMDDMQKMAEQMKRSDPSAAEAMEKAAQTAKQQNVQKQQQQAAQNAKQNQQAPAQSAQRQAELGLEMMLNQLREAERNRLAELSKKLEELQKQIANLIRRQSGHNLDNLTVQGPEALAKIGNDLLGGLFAKSQRDPKQPPAPPAVPQLGQSQEQTERNTRDIAKSAEGMPNGAEPASHLVRAAGKMERANFSLRDSKLPEAYDPSQVEALVALEQAKKLVDEQKDKVDEQIADSDREAVRAKYVKIKEDQEKLNADTTRIDQSKDAANGQVPRAEAIRLGQLPGEQGKLADRVSSIDKDLAEVGSIVYVWANKDISASMNGVKTDLGKPDTGAPIQDQQKRIVAQLDAMIRNLAIKPKESKFAQDSQGGGQGQQGGPKLPTEAELRLLKDLQTVVNDDTTAIDAKPDKQAEKPKLQALGNRQGDLRGLLDKLLQESSKGETKLGPEPDKASQLPEEAQEGDIENQELDQNLLNDKPEVEGQEKQAMLVGDRMARSRQRLALNNDPGKVTQMIQKRIVIDLDNLIEQARQQQAQTRNQKPNNSPGEKMPAPGENGKQPANSKPQTAQNKTNASNPAAESMPGVDSQKPETDVTKNIKEELAEWGALTPRQREAILQGGDDQVLGEYRKLVDDYWRALSTKAKDR
ncbi:MAG: hypothetical protein H7Z14_10175, partial [Anaerolineae bacterium]|nr:hypothetical protein [Phycisphaerae bacterium]